MAKYKLKSLAEEPVVVSTTHQKELDKVYLVYNAHSNNRIEIAMPFIPDSVSYNYNANFTSQSFLGRKSPIFIYSNGSKKAYSFSIAMNEDILDSVTIMKDGQKKKPIDLIELVDNIKMLSYPVKTINGIVSFPQTFFQVGLLSGYGIIQTSIEWKKPFRNGHYINVSISFDITVEKDIAMPKLTTIYQQVESEGIFYDIIMRVDLSEEEFEERMSYLKDKGYNVSLNNLLALSNGSDLLKSVKKTAAIENFEYQQKRLNGIYETFATSQGLEAITDLEFLKELQNVSYDSLYTEDKRDAKQIRKAKKAFEDYLTYYYDEVNTTMTRDEYDKIIDEVYTILEDLQRYAEEVLGYGQGN